MTHSAAAAVPAVSMRGIVKSFGTVEVLKSVDMEIMRGEVHALAGENGAGKSTLMKILQGVHPVTSGEIYVAGERVQISDPHDAERAGSGWCSRSSASSRPSPSRRTCSSTRSP